jgi:hypothetical protein
MNADEQYAQKAFPLHRIQGAGTIAVRLECSMVVELVSTNEAARIVAAAQCCRYCHMKHFIHQKKATPAPVVLDRTDYGE